MMLNHIIILQNKIDLVSKEQQSAEQYKQILQFVKGILYKITLIG